MNNLPKVVTQQRRGRVSNLRLLDRKSDALPLSHRATLVQSAKYQRDDERLKCGRWDVISSVYIKLSHLLALLGRICANKPL